MNASWSMVLGALLAGTVGGFMIPVRPEIRDVPALTVSKATEPAEKPAADKVADTPTTAKTENTSGVRKIPLIEAASRSAEPNAEAELNRQADANSCAKETWPYRSPSCLDRTATVAPADTVVAARPVDPKVSLQDTTAEKVSLQDTTAETASKPETAPAKPEAAKSQQKIVSTPPTSEEQASTGADEPRAKAASERPKKSTKKPRRSTRRVNREPVDLDDGIPTRIYLRGPDGRLYLAPEYRPGRTIYYMR